MQEHCSQKDLKNLLTIFWTQNLNVVHTHEVSEKNMAIIHVSLSVVS